MWSMKKSVAFLLIALCLSHCGGGDHTKEGDDPPPQDSSVTGLPANPSADPSNWWNQSVFYEVFVRSYADSTEGSLSNDGVGDLRGLIERLDYLNDGDPNTNNDLGITAIWVMPVMQSPSYHGYDVTDYFSVENDYGTNADFKAFVDAAHERGIRVIVDLVLNHASSRHPRFLNSRSPSSAYRDWFIWSDNNPGGQGPWGQAVWHRSNSAWYYGLFWSGMPDWNFNNEEVIDHLHMVSRHWLENMDVDGFRLDAIRYLFEEGSSLQDTPATHQWLQNYISFYKSIKADAMTVGEVWATSDIVASYADEMDITFQFDLASAILEVAEHGNGSRLEAEAARAWANFEPSQFATFITNHDQNRVMSQLAGNLNAAKFAATILLSLPGVPFIYYGEEIGMKGTKPDEQIRRPLQWSGAANAGFSSATPWIAPNSDYPTVNIAIQSASPTSLLSTYRKLIHIRQDHPALLMGNYTPVNTSTNNLIAFLRQSQNQNILVLLNVSSADNGKFSVALDASYDQGIELLHDTILAKGQIISVNGVEGYQPIELLKARTGYILLVP